MILAVKKSNFLKFCLSFASSQETLTVQRHWKKLSFFKTFVVFSKPIVSAGQNIGQVYKNLLKYDEFERLKLLKNTTLNFEHYELNSFLLYFFALTFSGGQSIKTIESG